MSTERYSPHPATPTTETSAATPSAANPKIVTEDNRAAGFRAEHVPFQDAATKEIRRRLANTALASGIGLLFLAIAAPIANFVLIPSGMQVLAAILFLLVALVDIYLGFSIAYVLDPKNSPLAKFTAISRALYGAALVIACIPLFLGNVELFNGIWHIALIEFGVHLLLVALLGVQKRTPPIWTSILVGIAGVGYIADGVIMPAIATDFEVSTITFIGEVVLMIWFLCYRLIHRQPQQDTQLLQENA